MPEDTPRILSLDLSSDGDLDKLITIVENYLIANPSDEYAKGLLNLLIDFDQHR